MPKPLSQLLPKQLGASQRQLVFFLAVGVVGIAVAGLVLLFFRNRWPTTRPVTDYKTLPYWESSKSNVLFVWQPQGERVPVQINGEELEAGKVLANDRSPGMQLVDDGYVQVDLYQGEPVATEAVSGFQKDQNVCVLNTAVSNGVAGMLEDNPELDYTLTCGVLP